MKKVERIERGLQVVENTAVKSLESASTRAKLIEASQLLGAVRATNTLGRNIAAQSFRGLMLFRDRKDHEAFGFERFDDFLNEHPQSPMTKNQFYDRLNVIEREGDEAFDLLNSLRVPLSTRKLLASGVVQIDNDVITIGEETINVADSTRVMEALKILARKGDEQKRTIDRGKKEVKSLKKQLDQAEHGPQAHKDSTPYGNALVVAICALTALAGEADKLPMDEMMAVRDNCRMLIRERAHHLECLLGYYDDEEGPTNGKTRIRPGDDDLGMTDDEVAELGDAL
jgi:hypothetical protein